MRTGLLIVGLFALIGVLGCATLTKTPEENNASIARAWEMDSRSLAEDCNMVMMLDRPSRLSRWTIR